MKYSYSNLLYIAPERQSIIAEETEYIEVGCVNCDMVLGGDEILKSDIISMGYQEAIAKFIGFHLCSRCQPDFKLVVKVEAIPTPYNLLAAGRRAANYVKSLPPRIEAKDGRTLEDGGDKSFPNY